MKQFIPQVGGHDLRLDDFVVMEQAYSEALEGVISALDPTGNCILSGVNMSGTTTISFTSGYVAFLGEVFSFAAQDLSYVFSSRLFLKVVETVITPSSPVPYEDTTIKNIHFERVMIMKYFNSVDGDINGVNGIYYDSINWAGTFQKGMVIEWYPSYPGEENFVFDSTGLGKYRLRGYQVCNGNGVSPDLRGQFTFMPSVGMFNSSALLPNVIDGISISQRFGSKTRSILTTNLPTAPVNITIDQVTPTAVFIPPTYNLKAQSIVHRDFSAINSDDGQNYTTWQGHGHGAYDEWVQPWHDNSPWGSLTTYTGGNSPRVSWTVDVNTPFDDWLTSIQNGSFDHSQQPAGFNSNTFEFQNYYGWIPNGPNANTSGHLNVAAGNASNATDPHTINGFEKIFTNKITSSGGSVTVNPFTPTGSGTIAGDGTPFITVPPGFSMIKLLRL